MGEAKAKKDVAKGIEVARDLFYKYVADTTRDDLLRDLRGDQGDYSRFVRLDAEIARVRAMRDHEQVTFRRIEAQHQAQMAELNRQERTAQGACRSLAEDFRMAYSVDLTQYRYEPGEARYIRVETPDGGQSAVSGHDDGVQPGG